MEATPRSLQIGGYRFAFMECGEGAPVVFVHGSMSDYRTWQAQLRTFAGRYRAIAYSRRYHWPNAPIPDGVDYAMDQHVADLAAIIEQLGVAPAHLVGHSYGAFLCLLLVVRRPELVRSLVLAEPPVVTLFVGNPPKMAEILKLFAARPRTAAAIVKFGARGLAPATKAFQEGNHEKGLEIFGKAVLGKETFANLPNARREQVRDNLIAAEFLGSGFSSLQDEWLRGIQVPVLLPVGMRSPSLFHRLCERLEELIPRARCAHIPGASHIVHEDNTFAFDRTVETFLSQQCK